MISAIPDPSAGPLITKAKSKKIKKDKLPDVAVAAEPVNVEDPLTGSVPDPSDTAKEIENISKKLKDDLALYNSKLSRSSILPSINKIAENKSIL
jgi:hypothetical protein